jgi:hypothetical protein
MTSEYLDKAPAGDWFVLDVRRMTTRGRDWVALMSDVELERFQNWEGRIRWVLISGKHRNRNDAWDALEDMMATRH